MSEHLSTKIIQKRPMAGCVIKDNKKRILLIHRNVPGNQQWEMPGGKFSADLDKDLKDTALREVSEELGVEVEILSELGEEDFTNKGRLMRYAWLEARIISGTPSPIEEMHDKIGYFSKKQLQKMTDLSANLRNFVAFHYE
jgi:ADP-ribose pyrophosphatase YjhB (NUDIX family)